MFQHLDGEFIALIKFAGCIHNQEDDVAAFQGLAHLDHHFPPQRTVWLVYARCIDQDDLRTTLAFALGNIDDALNSVTRSLRLGRNNGELFAHKSIEQRGLASVRTAENTHKTGAEGHRKEASSCWLLAQQFMFTSSIP